MEIGRIMITEKIWQTGLSLEEYINKMDIFKKEMEQRVKEIYITSSEFQRFKNFQDERKILVLTDTKCKDSLMNLPIVAKIVEAAPNITLKIFLRNEHFALWDFFKNQGIENIPIFWVMKSDYSFCGVWVERPKSAYKLIDQWMNEHPEYVSIKNDDSLSDKEKEEKNKPLSDQLLDEMWNWYDTGLQSETIKEFFSILNC